jgi:methionyl-tRNA formyltransferase
MFLGKKNDLHTDKALKYLKHNFKDVFVDIGKQGDSLPEDIGHVSPDYIISYLSPWVLPKALLDMAKIAAINFHPAPPEYPGTGCTNFALYEDAKQYGVTCHHMKGKVDTGEIICVKRFPIHKTDNVETLLTRTYDYQLAMFYDVINQILDDKALVGTGEKWGRKPFNRKQLNDLATITSDMSSEEVNKRIKATTFGPWKPIVKIDNYIFELKPDK